MEDVAKYVFVAAAAVALFAWMTISQWITTRSQERRERDRTALLRRVAEQPPATAELMRELLREEEARLQAQRRRRVRQDRLDGLQGGVMLLAIGVGVSLFLFAVAPAERVWTVGLLIVLIGLVSLLFAYFGPAESPEA